MEEEEKVKTAGQEWAIRQLWRPLLKWGKRRRRNSRKQLLKVPLSTQPREGAVRSALLTREGWGRQGTPIGWVTTHCNATCWCVPTSLSGTYLSSVRNFLSSILWVKKVIFFVRFWLCVNLFFRLSEYVGYLILRAWVGLFNACNNSISIQVFTYLT